MLQMYRCCANAQIQHIISFSKPLNYIKETRCLLLIKVSGALLLVYIIIIKE